MELDTNRPALNPTEPMPLPLLAALGAAALAGVAVLALRFARDPLPAWLAFTGGHSDLGWALTMLETTAGAALVLFLAAAVLLGLALVRDAVRHLDGEVAQRVVLSAAAVLVWVSFSLGMLALLEGPARGEVQPFAPWLRGVWIVVSGFCLVAAPAMLATALRRAQFSSRLLRWVKRMLLLAAIATLASLGVGAVFMLIAERESPGLLPPPLATGSLVLLAVSAALALGSRISERRQPPAL